MSWFVALTPLLLLPLLGLLRLVGCSLAYEAPVLPPPDEEDPDPDPDRDPAEPHPLPVVRIAPRREELHCPIGGDEPHVPALVELRFPDPERHDLYAVDVDVTFDRPRRVATGLSLRGEERSEAGEVVLRLFLCVEQRRPLAVRVSVRPPGSLLPVVSATCESPAGVTASEPVLFLRWDAEGTLVEHRCFEEA